MNKKKVIGWTLAAVTIGAFAFWGFQNWRAKSSNPDDLLSFMPGSATGAGYVNLHALRNSPFLAELYAWSPQRSVDADYAEFMKATGFNYERDLDRVAIAVWNEEGKTFFFAIAEGRFDNKKITNYAMQFGSRMIEGNRNIYSVPMNGSAKKISFTFLQSDRIAITDQPELKKLLDGNHQDADAMEWRIRLNRLEGSPMFAVIRQEAAAGSALAKQTAGGWRSPQLSALLDQLRWVTFAGKPQGDRLSIVIDGECAEESVAQRLADSLNGILLMAQAGLNDSKMRQQLEPTARDAYLELVRGADVSRIDRGEAKSVRLVFEVTPKFLQAARATVNSSPKSRPK